MHPRFALYEMKLKFY